MRRWHSEVAVMLRRRRVCQWIGREMPMGEMRKRHPLDCGQTQCGVCHPSKRWHHTARRNQRNVAIADQLEAM